MRIQKAYQLCHWNERTPERKFPRNFTCYLKKSEERKEKKGGVGGVSLSNFSTNVHSSHFSVIY